MVYLLDPGGENDNNAIRLGTRKSRHIRNETRPEWEPEQLRQGLQQCLHEFPNLEVRSVTALYNCVGMVFATRRTWVDTDLVEQLLSDDEYRRLPQIEDAQVGDIAVYKAASGEIRHVGFIVRRNERLSDGAVDFKVLSKWGPWAEFIHDPEDCFEFWGRLVEVWTDRRQP